jgi:mycofactocin precursor
MPPSSPRAELASLPSMDEDSTTSSTTSSTTDSTGIPSAADSTDRLIDDELLVEEISIDGMCGVY